MNKLLQALLSFKTSNEKSTVILMGLTNMECHFSLITTNTLSSLYINIYMMMFCGVCFILSIWCSIWFFYLCHCLSFVWESFLLKIWNILLSWYSILSSIPIIQMSKYSSCCDTISIFHFCAFYFYSIVYSLFALYPLLYLEARYSILC